MMTNYSEGVVIKESWTIDMLRTKIQETGLNPDKIYLLSFHVDTDGSALYHSLHEGKIVGKDGLLIFFEENGQKMMINADTDQSDLMFSFQDAEHPKMQETFLDLREKFLENLEEASEEILYH